MVSLGTYLDLAFSNFSFCLPRAYWRFGVYDGLFATSPAPIHQSFVSCCSISRRGALTVAFHHQADSRKRARPADDDDPDDDMTRVKAALDPAAMAEFATKSREDQIVLQKAASLLNIQLSTLLRQQEQGRPYFASTNSAPSPPPPAVVSMSDRETLTGGTIGMPFLLQQLFLVQVH